MKKRIFAFLACFMVVFASFTVFVGAEEATELAETQDYENQEYALTNVVDTSKFNYPAYSFTIKVGDEVNVFWNDALDTHETIANVIMIGHYGVYSSGKVLGDVTITNDYWDNIAEGNSVMSNKDKFSVVGEWNYTPKQFAFIIGDYEKSLPAGAHGFFLKTDDGVVTSIGGMGPGLRGATFSQIDVLISLYGGSDNGIDSQQSVETLVDYLETEGIEVQYIKGLTANGLIGLMFENFGTAVAGLAGGMRNTVTKLIYANGVNGELSVLVKFIFLIAGISIAMTVFYLVFRLIRFGRQR